MTARNYSYNNTVNKFSTKIYYPFLLHLQDATLNLGYKEDNFPVVESHGYKILTLPVHQYLEEVQLKYVIDCIDDFYS
jgi:UDP-2-acetamido-2-deoxy-ribo-hexuluronate aminotransferase